MKSYCIVRKYKIPAIGSFAWRRFVTLDDAVEFVISRNIVVGNPQTDDIAALLKAGAVFSSETHDVLRYREAPTLKEETIHER